MAKLSEEEAAQLKALQEKSEAPDEPDSPAHSRVENVNYTIDLDNEEQVRRAVRAGLLPKSYLEDDEPEPQPEPDPDDAPRRKLDRYQ